MATLSVQTTVPGFSGWVMRDIWPGVPTNSLRIKLLLVEYYGATDFTEETLSGFVKAIEKNRGRSYADEILSYVSDLAEDAWGWLMD